uniref:NADH-ubiquinone oxidoreductase chain 6 n=1 Tax=Nothobranchius foerschi TaxID=451737 RepID=A0A518LYD8_9TELE|nr:NADH dehydrogenase subunit 6 [Nothobranchius foerschi]QDW10500.1 NADH dehydrogenase subunit 6 [Nothobranchius foerschi]
MVYIVYLCMVVMVVGLGVVVSNSSPYFSALGLVVVAGACCVILACQGMSFYSLVLFLIYLGGMMVVFGFSTALVFDPLPVSLGSFNVLVSLIFFICLAFVIVFVLWGMSSGSVDLLTSGLVLSSLKNDTGGVSYLYLYGGAMLVFAALVLLLTLLATVGLVWGLEVGGLRSV